MTCDHVWITENHIIRDTSKTFDGITAESENFFDKYNTIQGISSPRQLLWWERLNTINPEDMIQWCIRAIQPQVIVELGCGDGINLLYCIKTHKSINHIIGCDVSLKALVVTRERLTKLPAIDIRKLTLFHCDASAVPVESGIADVVIMTNVLHHSSTNDPLIECARILRPGGILIFTDITNGNMFRNMMDSLFAIAPRSLRNLFSYDLLVDNEKPLIKLVRLREVRNILKCHDLHILAEYYRGLFLFVIQLVCIILPFVLIIIPKPLWWLLSRFERHLLNNAFIQQFAALYYSVYIKI